MMPEMSGIEVLGQVDMIGSVGIDKTRQDAFLFEDDESLRVFADTFLNFRPGGGLSAPVGAARDGVAAVQIGWNGLSNQMIGVKNVQLPGLSGRDRQARPRRRCDAEGSDRRSIIQAGHGCRPTEPATSASHGRQHHSGHGHASRSRHLDPGCRL